MNVAVYSASSSFVKLSAASTYTRTRSLAEMEIRNHRLKCGRCFFSSARTHARTLDARFGGEFLKELEPFHRQRTGARARHDCKAD